VHSEIQKDGVQVSVQVSVEVSGVHAAPAVSFCGFAEVEGQSGSPPAENSAKPGSDEESEPETLLDPEDWEYERGPLPEEDFFPGGEEGEGKEGGAAASPSPASPCPQPPKKLKVQTEVKLQTEGWQKVPDLTVGYRFRDTHWVWTGANPPTATSMFALLKCNKPMMLKNSQGSVVHPSNE